MEHSGFAVTARALTVQRGGSEVLHGIDLSIPAGQITGLLGPSGCGKSTLLRSVVGVQARVAGELTVLGERAGTASLRSRVTYATQAASVYEDLSVAQNLRYFARVQGLDSAAATRAIERVGLTNEASRRVHSLSGGQQGRVSLAIALLGDPELIVLDEPTVGLDPVLRAELWGLFRKLARAGATLLVSSHVMDEALRCDRLLLMRDGSLLADTTPSELLASTGTTDPEAAFLTVIARAAGTGTANVGSDAGGGPAGGAGSMGDGAGLRSGADGGAGAGADSDTSAAAVPSLPLKDRGRHAKHAGDASAATSSPQDPEAQS